MIGGVSADTTVGKPAKSATRPDTSGKVDTTNQPDYVPQVGDVVEFEFAGKTLQAIIHFDTRPGYNCLGSIDSDASRSHYWREASTLKNPRKLRSIDLPASVCDSDSARDFAEAYFAKSFTPAPDKSYAENQAAWVEFHGLKVGSKVKIKPHADVEDHYCIRKEHWDNSVCTVEQIESECVYLKEKGFAWPYFALEPVDDTVLPW